MILFEPVGAIILAYYFLGEKVILTQVIGGAVIMLGIILFLLEMRLAKVTTKQVKPAS
jgi:drug/metabolite transporter (DMT)-like permease